MFVASCSSIESQTGNNFNGRAGRQWGKADLGHYYLPEPYVQIYAYKIKIGTVENFHYGIRSIGVPNTTKPIALRHNYSHWREDDLQVTQGPDGLLERVAMHRDPKVIQSVGAVARAVLSVAAPVPLPFKGDAGFPEFSKLVHKENYRLEDLMKSGVHAIPLGKNQCGKDVSINIDAVLIFDDAALKERILNKCERTKAFPDECAVSIRGVYYRPLIPVKITISENIVDSTTTTNSEVIYCPNPTVLEKLEFPPSSLAAQYYEANFAAGTLYDISVSRKSTALAAASAPSEILKPFVGLPSELFTVRVYRNDGEGGGAGAPQVFRGGPKDPGNGNNPREKD